MGRGRASQKAGGKLLVSCNSFLFLCTVSPTSFLLLFLFFVVIVFFFLLLLLLLLLLPPSPSPSSSSPPSPPLSLLTQSHILKLHFTSILWIGLHFILIVYQVVSCLVRESFDRKQSKVALAALWKSPPKACLSYIRRPLLRWSLTRTYSYWTG